MNNAQNLGIKAKAVDPLGYAIFDPIQKFLAGSPNAGRKYYGEPAINTDTNAPTTDTSANLLSQQSQLRNMQRGVLSNIYAGGSAPNPSTGSRQLLGG